jgi:hypothetical protein
LGGNIPFRGAAREAPVFSKHPRRALGCQRVGKTLAFYGVKAGCRGKEIETVTVGVAGNDSRGAAGNFDDIGVGHESFLLLASVESIYLQSLSTEADAAASPPGTSG